MQQVEVGAKQAEHCRGSAPVLLCTDQALTLASQYLGGAGAIEGVGLQNISTSFQEIVMDVSNDIRTCNDQQIIVALQFVRVGLVALASEILLSQPGDACQVAS